MARHTVAVVDEDERFLEQISAQLSDAGYAVRTFSSPAGTYTALRSDPASATIIGVQFPGCRPGIDLATALKLDRRMSTWPLILTFADAERLRPYQERLRYNSTRSLWLLPKPVQAPAMLQILARTLGQLEREAS